MDMSKIDESDLCAIAESVKENSEKICEAEVVLFLFQLLSMKAVSKETFQKITSKSVLPSFPIRLLRDSSCGFFFLEYEQKLGLSDPPTGATTTCLQARLNCSIARHFERVPLFGSDIVYGPSLAYQRFLALPSHIRIDILLKQQMLIAFRSERAYITQKYDEDFKKYNEKTKELREKFLDMFEGPETDKATA
jgi:hypothetical protein